MRVEHFLGNIQVNNIYELQELLCITTEQKVNEFWISGIDDYPCLCISVNKEFAHVHYFEDEGQLGFQAVSHLDLNEESYVFYTNNASEMIEIEKDYVIKIEDAIKIACNFFQLQQLPECAEWEEL